MQTGARLSFDRQQLAIAPEALRTRLDPVARQERRNRLVVVSDLERTQTLVADPERGRRERGLAQVTAEAEIHAVFSRSIVSAASPAPSGGWAATIRIVAGN